MTRRDLGLFTALLIVLGAAWGFTLPLSKIAVSTGYGHFGLIFWQMVIGAVAMAIVVLARGSRLPLTGPAIRVYTIIALVGSVIPNSASYQSIAHLPAGVVSILMSLIPMIAFPMALGLGLERFSIRRFFGLLAGLAGVSLLVFPEASLPDVAMLAWIPLALVGPLFYAFEGSFIAKWGIGGLDAIQVLLGASIIGAIVTLPLALATGQFLSPLRIYAAPEWALIASSLIHVVVYAIYVWMVGRAGAVFAVQVSYLVTGFGMVWAMVMLGESYSSYIWVALVLMLGGVFLVQPRPNRLVAPNQTDGQDKLQQKQRVAR